MAKKEKNIQDKKEKKNQGKESAPEEMQAEQPSFDETEQLEDSPGVEDKLAVADITRDELWEYCQQEFCSACPLIRECQEKQKRAIAEAQNQQKRIQREKEEFCKYASAQVVEDLLPVLDNLDLAIEHAGDDEACKGLREGVEMTRKVFLDTLEKHGLSRLGEKGERFDPNIHEAMAQEETEEMDEGHVSQMMQKGYKLNNRLLRPAKVVVSKKCAEE